MLGDGHTVTLTAAAGPNGQIIADTAHGGFDVQLSYTYAQELAGQTFGVSVTDQTSTTAQMTSSFSVLDAPPAVTADQTTITAVENTMVLNTGTFSDFDDPVTITASTGTVTQTGSQQGTWSWSGPAVSDGSYDVTILAANAGGSQASAVFHVEVTDAPPMVTVDQAAVSAWEGTTATNSGTWSDFDDPVTLSASRGSVTQHSDGTWSWSLAGDEIDSGSVTILATNSAESTAAVSFQVTFADRPPTIASDSSEVSAPENGLAANGGTFSDADDAVTISVLSGGGTVTQTGSQSGSWSWTGTGDEGTQTVVILATNTEGSTATTSFDVVFTDVPLTGSDSATAGGIEGGLNSSVLEGATFTDANPGDHTGDFSVAISWGDSSQPDTTTGSVSYDAGSGAYTVHAAHTYAEDGTYSITVTVTDVGGQTATITGSAIVAESPPALSAGTDFTSVAASDSGLQTVAIVHDTVLEPPSSYQATIDWGDGNDSPGTLIQTSPGEFQVEGNHTYAAAGEYSIRVSLTDDGATISDTTDTATVVDPWTVINTLDSGPGSLRQVIANATALPGPSRTVTFAIPDQPQVIDLLSPLPGWAVPLDFQLDVTQDVTVSSPTGGARTTSAR